jgi:hypothetical protein
VKAASVILQSLTSPIDSDEVRQATADHFDWSHLIIRYCHEVFR